jgi:hypothetical protein
MKSTALIVVLGEGDREHDDRRHELRVSAAVMLRPGQ